MAFGSRRFSAALVLLALVLVAFLNPSAAPAASVVLQDIGTRDYPEVSLGVALSADLIPDSGSPTFVVLENGIEVSDVRAQVAAEERAPMNIVLLVDVSGSMRGAPLAGAQAAAKRLVSEMRPTDRIAFITFASEPRLVLDFTSDVAELEREIDALGAAGETALYDGLIQAARAFGNGESDRAIIVLSDGGDTTSIGTLDAAATALVEAEAPLYAVALESPEYDPAVLEQLALRSGGSFTATQDATVLADIFGEIARELRELYTLSFTSARPSTKSLELEVRVVNGDSTGVLTTVVDNPLYVEAPPPEPPIARDTGLLEWAGLFGVSTLVFGAVVLAVLGVGSMLAPGHDMMEQLRYYDQYRVDLSDDTVQEETVRGARATVIEAVTGLVESRGFTAMVRESLERAGLPLRPNEYIYLHVLATMVVGFAVQLSTGNLALSLLAIVFAVVAPMMYVRIMIDRRTRRFEEQLPDVLSLIAGSLRAGWGIQQSLELVVDQISEPAAGEFRRVQGEIRFGLPLEQALSRMADRLGSQDFEWTVTAIAIQREVGGNLAEVLDIVADTVRTRAELRRHVSALTAESRFSALVLTIMPFFIIGLLAVISPAYLGMMLGSRLGLTISITGLVLLAVGVVWIIRLTKVEV